ncbi:hypothetical protein CYY_009038 [Polysphondylium violaceum]|uniref:Uncharacterized protein n=1 Tax=Polysphondylium violaceum TaxID=133409 RepID=A0A8J4V3D4_9MYCE|nr:hypothetical protein CYY_009038 [Polysphondylium violaceum]
MGPGNWVLLALEFLIIGGVVIICMKQYVSFKKLPLYSTFTAWLGWFLCFSIVFLVPVDILATDHNRCLERSNGTETECIEPITFLPESVMTVQWKVLYWGTFILSWAVFPILQTFALTGDFRFQERIYSAIKDNLVLYLIMGIGGGVGIIALLIIKNLTIDGLLGLGMLLANAYGLILVVLTMGFGLVDVPRNLFRKASPYRTLRHYRVQAVVLKNELETAQEKLVEHLKLIKVTSDKVGEYDPYRPYLDLIISKCPLQYDSLVEGYTESSVPIKPPPRKNNNGKDDEEGLQGDELLTYRKLVNIHATLMDLTDQTQRGEILYERLLGKAFATEDIIATIEKPKEERNKQIQWSFKNPSKNASFEYYWHLYIYPNYYKIVGIFCALLSGIVVWSEISLPFSTDKTNLSPFAAIISKSEDSLSGLWLQVFCFIPLLYMAICSYTTLFKIRIFNYYRLVPHATNAMSIMFSANYLCRLAAPLSYNFLQLCDLNDASFSTVMGDMDAFSLKHFNLFFPIFVGVVFVASLFNIHKRIAGSCCIKSMRAITDTSESAVDHGMNILKQVREERTSVGGVPPPKTRLGIIKDMFVKKDKNQSSSSSPDGANAPMIPGAARYKAPAQPKSVLAIPKLSRDYTSKSGTVFSSINNNNSNSSSSGANHAILDMGNTAGVPKSSSDRKSLLNDYWDKMNFNISNDNDSFDDIELGTYKNKK